MASLGQYFETDFSNVIRVHITVAHRGEKLPAIVLKDPVGHTQFVAVYDGSNSRPYEWFVDLVRSISAGGPVEATGKVTLPSAKLFPGQVKFTKTDEGLRIDYQLTGDPTLKSADSLPFNGRLFIYTETVLSASEITRLQEEAAQLNVHAQLRSAEYKKWFDGVHSPVAFISHDSRDKDTVARPIAVALKRWMCPVWYDEFSLKVGDPLRESIEKGLKECRKCILVLSPAFLTNGGWTKVEFNSIFTREILEEKKLILPVWFNVTKQQVYEYSPTLLNVVGLNWAELGEEEVCRRLHRAIED